MALTGYKNTARTTAGPSVPGAAVEVRRTADNTLATLFTDAGGGTPLVNPFTADGTTGAFEFYTEPDRYNVLLGTLPSQVSFPIDLVDSRENLTFDTLVEFEAWVDGGGGAPDGAVVTIGNSASGVRVQFVAEATAAFSGLKAGWRPYGDAAYDHWLENTIPGSTDMSAAIASAHSSGLKIRGGGRTYGVTGEGTFQDNNDIADVIYKELNPDGAYIVVGGQNKTNLTLRNVGVDMGGDGTNGGQLDASGTNGFQGSCRGFNLDGGTGHTFDRLFVFGANSCTGIRFANLDYTTSITLPTARDMSFNRTTGLTDDNLQGVLFANCEGMQVQAPRAINLLNTADSTSQYTRGTVLNGCTDMTFTAPLGDNVSQGFDITGGDGNVRCNVVSPIMRDCYTHGVKLANTARDCLVTGGLAYRVGRTSFLCSGPGSGGQPEASGNKFKDCKAIDNGFGGNWGNNAIAFRNAAGSSDLDRPIGTKFIDCFAEDTTGNMYRGFDNDNTIVAGDDPTECIRCESIGHTNAAISGFHEPVVQVKFNANTPIATGTTRVEVAWDVSTQDNIEAHDTVTQNTRVYARKKGYYRIDFAINWDASATGERFLQLNKDGTKITDADDRIRVPAGTTMQTLSRTVFFEKGEYLEALVAQTSGGNLNILANTSNLQMVWVRD